MRNEEFYKILDNQLDTVIANFPVELASKLKQENQKKSHALLVWFLNFYSKISNVEDFITDGHGDNSCDIILDKVNSQGERVFYLVQSKWNAERNCNGHFEQDVLKSFLSDAQSILRGDKKNTENSKFNSRYKSLKEHVLNNGEVKVIYLTLKNSCKEFLDNVNSFKAQMGGRISVESFDINRLKLDYIDREYKKSAPPSPLDKVYSPEFEKIIIRVARDDERNSIKIEKPFEGYVFNVKPKIIHELVDRYGVSLFDKNVRNPLMSSSINNEIISSLKNNPSYFWYYNNGITGITRSIPPIGSQAENFEITGLQVINGAQTAYSIYLAYSEASHEEREIMDSEARITFRLLKSGGKDFDLKVTRYTNSQNPVSDRDFWSNDEIQQRIQNYFYTTNVWYEKRAGEFRKTPKDIVKVANSYVASAYLAFELSDPVSVFEASISRDHQDIDLIFTSHKDNQDGLYEKIFNKNTSELAMFASFCMLDILTDIEGFDLERLFFSNGFHILAMSRVVLEKYLSDKFKDNLNVHEFVKRRYLDDDTEIIKKCFHYASKFMKKEIESAGNQEKESENVINIMTKHAHFELLLEKLRIDNVVAEDIDSIKRTSDMSTELDEEKLESREVNKAVH